MPIQCPQCQKVNRDSAQFCDNCGASLAGNYAESGPIKPASGSRPDSLPESPSRYLPEANPRATCSQDPEKLRTDLPLAHGSYSS